MENKKKQQEAEAKILIAMDKKKGITMEDAVKIMEQGGTSEED